MNNNQVRIVDIEIVRLLKRQIDLRLTSDYTPVFKDEVISFIDGKIDGLKWVKENTD